MVTSKRPPPQASGRAPTRPAPGRPARPGAAAPAPRPAAPAAAAPLTDADLAELQQRLDALPAPLEPLDVMALDGYLCGVLLLPRRLPPAAWQPHVLDVEGRQPPPGADAAAVLALAARRHAELDAAIERRAWFDPWIFEASAEHSPTETVLPWVAGFATALDRFPDLDELGEPALLEPLALVYLHLDPDDLVGADALLAAIEAIEPPPDLDEAVQDLVRAVMLIADVTRPKLSMAPGKRPQARGGARRPRPSAGSRPASKRR